jgi:hypothetical protein
MKGRVLLIFVVIACVALGGYLITWLHSIASLGESDESLSPSQIEAYSRIRIPPAASNVLARLDQVITKRTLYIRFSVESAEVESFLQDSPFHEPLSESALSPLLLAQSRPDWFKPEQAPHYLTGETASEAILIDTSASSHWVIYLVVRS